MNVNSRRSVTVILVAVVFVAIGIAVGLAFQVPAAQASAEAVSVDTLFKFMLAIAAVVFLIVEVGIIYSIIFFRRKPGDDTDGPANHGNTALEVTWTAIPAVIVVVLTIYSYRVFADMQTPQSDALIIHVTGQQFVWSFQYDDPNKTDTYDSTKSADEAMANDISQNMVSPVLYMPVNRHLEMHINAVDVLHGFYIPAFRIKQDAIPGRESIIRFTPTEIGEYTVECSELCGQGHATMHTTVKVLSQADYDTWFSQTLANTKKSLGDPTNWQRGKQLIQTGKYPCAGCHALADADIHGSQGPAWDGVYTRALNNVQGRLTGSGITATGDDAVRQYLTLSIEKPSLYLVPGFQDLMPKLWGVGGQMPDADREAIVNYLLRQK
ncbi:MAG TPA: cytochrome c oxidase subunit II [Aggregatilineales bacterium]|nr:cytochrome c oxidase subunit II [Aggregatilineales bacterium]